MSPSPPTSAINKRERAASPSSVDEGSSAKRAREDQSASSPVLNNIEEPTATDEPTLKEEEKNGNEVTETTETSDTPAAAAVGASDAKKMDDVNMDG